jgi:lysophospholipase L1-like esterase
MAALADSGSLLTDVNGDGVVRVLAFGDSITFGIGDGTQPGQVVTEAPMTDGREGYPARVEADAGVPVDNSGRPGEELTLDGIARLPRTLAGSSDDVVILFEGSNDALHMVDPAVFEQTYQRAVNVARFLGKTPVITSIPPTCCDRAGRAPFIDELNASIENLAAINGLRVADVAHAFQTTCGTIEECGLLNRPEGLHPNSKGYDAIAQVMLAALSGVDLFAADGAKNLEAAFNLPPGSVIVKPDSAAP